MRLHRFLVSESIEAPEFSLSDAALIKQLRLVLRLEVGNKIILTDGTGREVLAQILELTKDNVTLKTLEITSENREASRAVTLYCSLLKRENFELVVQKAVELGVSEIVPLLCTRTVKLSFNRERCLKIIKEAVEQSGRSVLPRLADPIPFVGALQSMANYDLSLLFDASGAGLPSLSNIGRVAAFIGPEGGWTPEELAEAGVAGLKIVTLGPRTLRAETAALIACYELAS